MSFRPAPELAPLLKVPRVAWPTVALAAAIAAAFTAGLATGVTHALPALASMALVAAAAFAAFTVMHDASHGLVSRVHWVNALLGHAAASVLFSHFLGFRQIHRRHHRFAGDPARDPDRWSGEGPAWKLPLRWATADLHYYVEHDFTQPLPRRESAGGWIATLALLGVIAAFVFTGHARELLLFWVLPSRVALFCLTYSFDYVPHQRPYAAPVSENPLLSSCIIRGGRVVDGLLLYQNLHLVHHLYPTAPFYRYRRIWRAVSKELLARGAREVPLLALPRPFYAGPASGPFPRGPHAP